MPRYLWRENTYLIPFLCEPALFTNVQQAAVLLLPMTMIMGDESAKYTTWPAAATSYAYRIYIERDSGMRERRRGIHLCRQNRFVLILLCVPHICFCLLRHFRIRHATHSVCVTHDFASGLFNYGYWAWACHAYQLNALLVVVTSMGMLMMCLNGDGQSIWCVR